MILTEENYFSESADMKYFGRSQYKAFSKCEEKALAELQGRYIRQDTTALLVGSYAVSYTHLKIGLGYRFTSFGLCISPLFPVGAGEGGFLFTNIE